MDHEEYLAVTAAHQAAVKEHGYSAEETIKAQVAAEIASAQWRKLVQERLLLRGYPAIPPAQFVRDGVTWRRVSPKSDSKGWITKGTDIAFERENVVVKLPYGTYRHGDHHTHIAATDFNPDGTYRTDR